MLKEPKSRRRLYLLLGVVGFLFLATGWYGFIKFFFQVEDPCDYIVKKELPSPDGKLKIVIYERDCGAFGGPDPGTTILPSIEQPTGNSPWFPGDAHAKPLRWVGPRMIEAGEIPVSTSGDSTQGKVLTDIIMVPTGWFSKEPVSVRYESNRK
jgi:hypothetical protein